MRTLKELMEFSKKYVLKPRLTKERIEKDFSEFLGFEFTFTRFDYDDTADFTHVSTLDIGEKLLYFDFHFLFDRNDFICITEFAFEGDNSIHKEDYNLEIKGVAQ